MSRSTPSNSVLQFACGAIAGGLLGLFLAVRVLSERPFILCAAVSILCGVLSIRYGDRFWGKFIDMWW